MTRWRTFSELRGDVGRDWLRWSDLLAAARAAGVRSGPRQIRSLILRTCQPPERRYGHFRYRQEHLDAVLATAGRRDA